MRPRLARISEESLHGLCEIARQIGEGGEEQVAEAVAFEAAALGETVLEQLGKQRLVFRKRDHAVANVAGRQDIEIAAEASGTAAIIGDRDNGGDLDFSRLQGVPFQAVQKRREAGSASDGDNTKRFHLPFYRIAGSELG